MATSVVFDGKTRTLPGVFSTIKSGIKNPSINSAFGNCLIIDTGSGAHFGGGSGIVGTFKSAKDSLYTFDNVRDFQRFVGGGLWWGLSAPIFNPGGGATSGASSLTYVRAAITTPASISYTFTGGGPNGGTLVAQVRDEGDRGNGVLGDETRATAVVTVTDYGDSDASVYNEFVSVILSGITVATYNLQVGDVIANIVTGLVLSAQSLGYVDVISSNATQLVITALRGKGATVNGTSPTISAGGGAWATAAAFSGGITGSLLTRGYGAKMIAGISDSTKFILQIYRGSFRGLDTQISNGDPFDGVAETSTVAELVAQSPEFTNISTLITWAQSDPTFVASFNLLSSSTFGTGAITSADLAVNSSYKLAVGGTETFSNTYLNTVLDNITDLSYDFILADNWGANARSTNNLSIQSFAINDAKVKPDIYVGAGIDSTKWNSGGASDTLSVTAAFNSQYVTVVHGGIKKASPNGSILKKYDSIYKAAQLMGREAGLAPQIPLTFKSISIDGELHNLTDKEAILGLNGGALMTRLSGNTFSCIKGVNSTQSPNNVFLVNTDGSTHSKQLARIERQLNKELIINLTQLLKKPDGSNRNTLNQFDVKAFVEAYLNTKVATTQADNLILSYRNITVSFTGDVLSITYGVVPNLEVSFVLITGFLLDPSTNS